MRNPTFWRVFLAAFTAPASFYAAPAPYFLYVGGVPHAFAAVGALMSQASADFGASV